MADGELRLENVKSLLDDSQKSTDVMVGAVREGFVQQGFDPEGAYFLPPVLTSTTTGTWSLSCPHSWNNPISTDPNFQPFGTNM
jgi:hypothetical protein